METRKRVFAEEYLATLDGMNNPPSTLNSQSRTNDDIVLMERCFQLHKHFLGS
jgi:hypothetical protein